MRTKATLVALAVAAGTALASPVQAQEGGEIMQTALDRYVERTEGVNDYTITYSGVMGSGEITTYFEKEMVDGFPVFRPVSVEGFENESGGFDPYRKFPEIAERADYEGTEEVDGIDAHVVSIDDFEGLDVSPPNPGQGDFEPERMTLWIDGSDWLIRRMRIEGIAEIEGDEKPLTMVASLRDYRTVEGMPFPYETAITVEGALAASGMSDEEAAETRQKLEDMREQLANMPEEQREMMERLMGPQIEQLEEMVGSGTFEMTLEVKDLQVNTPRDAADETPPVAVADRSEEPDARAPAENVAAPEEPNPTATRNFTIFHGEYGPSDDPESRRTWWVLTEPCEGRGLQIGAMWGDAAPLYLEPESETVFVGRDSGGRTVRATFEPEGGTPRTLRLEWGDQTYELVRSGNLPQGFDTECQFG